MGNITKNNPSSDPYRKQLTNDYLDGFIDNVGSKPFCLEKRVYYHHMRERYTDQITKRVEQRASLMTNMADAREWKEDTLRKLSKYAPPVIGYEYDEQKATLVPTSNFRSFRISRGAEFSGTLETTDKLKRYLGYAAAAIVIGLILAGGYVLRNAGLKALKALDTFDTRTETMEKAVDPNR